MKNQRLANSAYKLYGFGGTRKQGGLTMLEVLISLAVLSIGLAGLAAMQLASLQYIHSAQYRSMASTIALDFEERLWVAVSDNTLTGCPSEGTHVGNLSTYWNGETAAVAYGGDNSPKKLRIPNLTITTGTVVEDTTESPIKTIPITLGWNESRFSDTESTSEQFTFNARIICRQTSS